MWELPAPFSSRSLGMTISVSTLLHRFSKASWAWDRRSKRRVRQRSGGEDRWGQIEQMGIGWDAHLRSSQPALEGERRGDDCDGQYAHRLGSGGDYGHGPAARATSHPRLEGRPRVNLWPICSLFMSSTGEENSA